MTQQQSPLDFLATLGACHDARAWVAERPTASLEELWACCPAGDWMLWLCAALDMSKNDVRPALATILDEAPEQKREDAEERIRRYERRSDPDSCALAVACLSTSIAHATRGDETDDIDDRSQLDPAILARHADIARQHIQWARVAEALRGLVTAEEARAAQ